MSGEVIVASSLTKYYGRIVGVEEVSFSVRRGEVFAYLGPNGAGKTTTIRLMLGFLRPSRGTITVYGVDPLSGDFAKIKKFIGYVAEEFSFPHGLRGWDLVGYFSRVRGGAPRLKELLELFPLDLGRSVDAYSKGMKQMLALILAFMNDPDLLVLDEPTTGLDPLMRDRLLELLRREARKGKTVFLSSHVLSEVQRVADRVCLVKDGRVIAVEDLEYLIGRSGKVIIATLRRTPSLQHLRLEGVINVEIVDGRVKLMVRGGYEEILRELLSYGVIDIEIRGLTLEELFLHFYRRGGGG